MTKDITSELDSVFDILFYGFGYFFELLGSFEFHGISLFDFVIAITLLSAILPLILSLLRIDTIATVQERKRRDRSKRSKAREDKELQELKDNL